MQRGGDAGMRRPLGLGTLELIGQMRALVCRLAPLPIELATQPRDRGAHALGRATRLDVRTDDSGDVGGGTRGSGGVRLTRGALACMWRCE